MKLSRAGIWLGTASALLVVAFVVWDSQRASPGPVSGTHAQDPASGDDSCDACHGGFMTSMAAACNDCHREIRDQLEHGRGFHGTLTEDASRCETCHSEHHGREFELVSAGAFERAGVPDREAYRHERLGFTLGGDHLGLRCVQCHAHADDVLLAKGTKRFVGASSACAACHEDPHAGALPECASCHGETEPFARVAAFRHTEAFRLEGSHARAQCVDCHAKGSPNSIEALGLGAQRGAPGEVRACQACHAAPHADAFLALSAAAAGRTTGQSCEACHPPALDSFAAPGTRMTSADHALTGSPLDPPHAKAACAQCHAPGAMLAAPPPGANAAARFRQLHPGRGAGECQACHADPHTGQFDHDPFRGQGCRACHAPLAFEPTTFDVQRHAATAFPLTGSHAATACGACHTPASLGEPRIFHGTRSDCASCHADAHRGCFAARNVPPPPSGETGCARCHTTSTFADTSTKPFDHLLWTGFPLDGEHAQATCESCHRPAATPDEAGRTFGVIASLVAGAPDACASCHVDVHAGYFAARAPAGASGCEACHTPQSFREARARFDHLAATSFALDGAHRKAACEACHPRPSVDPAKSRRTTVHQGQGPFQDCHTCHADVHAGAFDRPGLPHAVEGRTGCERCHSTDEFARIRGLSFDHAAWTGFALEGAHQKIACAQCHAEAARDVNGRTFAFAQGTTCFDCHGDPHVGQFARNGQTSCERCHSTSSGFEALTFDHQKDSRFPLDATHARLDCRACHRPAPLPDGRSAIRYKPLGTACGDCHDPRGVRPRGPAASPLDAEDVRR